MNVFTKRISETLGLPERGVDNTLQLLDEGCTIPFICRYRKERTGGLDEVQIAQISEMAQQLGETAKRNVCAVAGGTIMRSAPSERPI